MAWKRIVAMFIAGIMFCSNSVAYAAEREDTVKISEEQSQEGVPDEVTAELTETYLQWLENPLSTYSTTKVSDYATELAKFPSDYQTLLKNLHKVYPNWIFVAVDTGLDWNDVVAGESYETRSLIQKSNSRILLSNASPDYNASTGEYVLRDGSTWVNASDPAIAYFVDPRNYLNKQYIFAMEVQSYESSCHTLEGVESILAGTDLANKEIVYTNTSGKQVSLAPLTYGKAILAAGASTGVSPLFLAAKIKQETGAKLTNGSISGTFSYNGVSYKGYYNFYNIGAYATATGSAIANGLTYAKGTGSFQRPWNSPVKAIQGGAEYLASNYIKRGQNTGYFQKFNTIYKPYYSYQYMQNISAAMSEGRTTYNSYNAQGILNSGFVFYIPVYDNMPSRTAAIEISKSNDTAIVTANVNMRKGPSTSYSKVVTIPKGAEVTVSGGGFTDDSIAVSSKLSNPYWLKVTYGSYSGYVALDYVKMNTSIDIKKGNSSTLKFSKVPSGESVYYETSNPAVATVNNKGVITGIGKGTCTIYAITSSGQSIDVVGVKVSTTLSKPTLVNAKNLKSGIQITWQEVSGAEGYYIYRKSSGGTYSKIGTVKSGTTVTYLDDTASSGTTYVYTVKAYAGNTSSSYNVTGITVLRLAQPVLGSVTVVNSSKLKVTWKKVSGADGYYVYRKVAGGNWSKIATVTNPDKLYFTNYYLNPSTTYNYTVCAYADGVRSTYSSTGVSGKTSSAKYTTYKVTTSVNYRTGAGTSYNKAGTLSKGTKIQVENGYSKKANGYTWYRFKYNSKTYYIASNYISKVTSSSNSSGSTTYTSYKTTASVNYRTGAGTSYSKAGTLAKGTKIQVEDGYSKKANGYTWYRFKYNSKTYYIASNYISKVTSSSNSSGSTTYTSYKTTASVNYRTGAGISYSKVGTLVKGSKVQVENGYSKKANGYTWYRVKINAKYYYIVSEYLKKV